MNFKPFTTANEQGQEDMRHPSGRGTESVRLGPSSLLEALLMRTGWQKGTVPYLEYLSTWAELFRVQISTVPLTRWAIYFTWAQFSSL